MSTINPATQNLLQSQLTGLQTSQAIDTAVARKSLDSAKAQGQAAIALLEQAVELTREMSPLSPAEPTLGQLASGLGATIDVFA